MLKLIPQEQSLVALSKKTKKKKQLMRLQMEIQSLEKTDQKLFQHVSRQLLDYMKKSETATISELNDLIHNLQRTVLGLQKKRINIIRSQSFKKKKK